MRILSPFPSVPTGILNIFITGRDKNREVINGENFDVYPYEDPHEAGVTKGFVKVFVENPGEFEPGIFSQASSVTEETVGGNTLVVLKKSEWLRNRFT